MQQHIEVDDVVGNLALLPGEELPGVFADELLAIVRPVVVGSDWLRSTMVTWLWGKSSSSWSARMPDPPPMSRNRSGAFRSKQRSKRGWRRFQIFSSWELAPR